MTAVAEDLQSNPLTVADFLALPEDNMFRWELQEGCLVMSSRPALRHQRALAKLYAQLLAQLPDHLTPILESEVDLELGGPDEPGFVRVPDIYVADTAAVDAATEDDRVLHASELLLAVEIVSPSSRRTDGIVKRAEYADAGIANYWIIDLDRPVSLLACHLAEEFGYMDDGAVTGTYTTTAPVPLTIELDRLR